MLFDIYFYNNTDVKRYLNRSEEEKREGKGNNGYEYLSEVSDIIDKQSKDDSNNLIINKKKFNLVMMMNMMKRLIMK